MIGPKRYVAALALPLVLAGCGSGHDAEVRAVAEHFHEALRSADGDGACDLLSDEVQKELQDSSGTACATQILDSGIPSAGKPGRVQVFDTAAQVRYGDDVVFLADFAEGWRITAAGCEKQASAPYDCHVHGG